MTTKKEDRRVKLSKIFLKNSLIDLLETKSISKITIKEICDRADINRATFYAHFSDQYALLKSIEEDYIENIIKDIFQQDKSKINTPLLTQSILTYIYDNAKMSKILLSDRADLHFQKRIMSIVHDNLLSQLVHASQHDLDRAQYISSYVITGCIGIIQRWFERDLVESPKEIAALISFLALTSLDNLENNSTIS